MGKCENILLVSDFDRTLTDHQDKIPQANLDAIEEFIKEGGAFTVATGHSVASHGKRCHRVPMSAPCITFNGAVIYDYDREEVIYAKELPDSAAQMAEELTKKFPSCMISLQTLQDQYQLSQIEDPAQRRILAMFQQGTDAPAPTRQKEPWIKLAITALPDMGAAGHHMPELSDPKDLMAHIKETMTGRDFFRDSDPATDRILQDVTAWVETNYPGQYTIVRSMPMMLEIQSAGVTKGTSARMLAGMLHRDRLICVGDAPNDVGMLDEADEAFLAADGDASMQNAGYHIASPSTEGTVASVIRELL